MNKIAVQPTNLFLVNPVNPVKIEFFFSRSVASIHHNLPPRCLVATWRDLRTPGLLYLQCGISIAPLIFVMRLMTSNPPEDHRLG